VSLGRKVAQYEAKSQLGTYSLDIRLNQDGNEFVIVVPCAPGAKAERSDPVVRAPTLAEAKQKVADLLKARDVPGFEDVIEYSCPTRERWAGEDDTHASFDFRVARVSTSRDPRVNRPLVEIGVEVSEKGEISEEVSGMTGEPYAPQKYHAQFDHMIPFTVERWRKCCAIKAAMVRLREMLIDLLGRPESAGAMLDSIQELPRLLVEVLR